MDNGGCDGFEVVYGNVLLSVRKIGCEPGKSSACDSEGGL
jgi:hypothetical protein